MGSAVSDRLKEVVEAITVVGASGDKIESDEVKVGVVSTEVDKVDVFVDAGESGVVVVEVKFWESLVVEVMVEVISVVDVPVDVTVRALMITDVPTGVKGNVADCVVVPLDVSRVDVIGDAVGVGVIKDPGLDYGSNCEQKCS